MPASGFGGMPPASGIPVLEVTVVVKVTFLAHQGWNVAQNNIITLSKAGYGEDNTYQLNPNAYHLTSLSHVSSSFNMPSIPGWAQDYVDEMDFINSITTPGSLWRWKEDPGGIIYKTKTPPFPISLPINIYQHQNGILINKTIYLVLQVKKV